MSDSKNNSGKRRALGRGLKNLIPDKGDSSDGRLVKVAVEKVSKADSQPRKEFDEQGLRELAASIEESGLIQPLVVREQGDGYELIAGERRLRACRRAEIAQVPVVIKDVTDAEAYALALVENIQREDLNPIEEATAYERLKEDLGLTQQALAERVGKSRSTIANATRLLKLPATVQQMLVDGDLSAGHARVLVPLSATDAERLATRIIKEGLTVREAEKLAKKRGESDDDEDEEEKTGGSRYRDDAQTRQITDKLQRALGTKVKLKDRDGKGKVEIHYEDYEILQSVLDRIVED